jgi:hypothetical protein
MASFVFNGVWAGGFLRNSLKRRLGFGVIGLEFYWSVSGKLSKRAEMPFLKVNGKSEVRDVKSAGRTRWSDLNTHLIGQHDFFGGKGSMFRVEPREIVRTIFHV